MIAYEMVSKYGMGTRAIYAMGSDRSKEEVEAEMDALLDQAFARARLIVTHSRSLIEEGAHYLVSEQKCRPSGSPRKLRKKYPYLLKYGAANTNTNK